MDRDQIRLMVLNELASHGLLPEEFGASLIKSAGLTKRSGIVGDAEGAAAAIGHAVPGLADVGTSALIAAPLVVGTLGGAAYYGMTRPDYNASIQKSQNDQLYRELKLRTRELNRRQPQNAPLQPGLNRFVSPAA